MGTDIMERKFQSYCMENPAFAGQFMLLNLGKDADYQDEDEEYDDDYQGEDDIGVAPEDLEASLLLGLQNERVFQAPDGFVVSTQEDMVE
jgi:hypothetical protein